MPREVPSSLAELASSRVHRRSTFSATAVVFRTSPTGPAVNAPSRSLPIQRMAAAIRTPRRTIHMCASTLDCATTRLQTTSIVIPIAHGVPYWRPVCGKRWKS